MRFIKFLITFSVLWLLSTALMAQPSTDIDLTTAPFEQIHLFVIGVLTYIWGLIAKFVPALKNAPIPTALVVVAGGLAVVLLAVFQGVGAIVPNLMAVLSAMGVYDLLSAIGRNKTSPEG